MEIIDVSTDHSESDASSVQIIDSDTEYIPHKPDSKHNSSGSLKREREQSSDSQGSVKKTKQAESGIADNADFISFGTDSESEDELQVQQKQHVQQDRQHGLNESSQSEQFSAHKDYPWILNRDHSSQRVIADWLSFEVKDYVKYISPSRAEILQRNGCIQRIKRSIESFWNDSHVYVFGSYATDLYLPHSDIDMVVKTDDSESENRKDKRQMLYKLANHLKSQRIVHDVQVIGNAAVPIIKFVESRSGIPVDISFERVNGLEAAKIVRHWLDSTPGLRELVLVVKSFLQARRLNDVHLGGLGGFSAICMVYVFLKLHPRLCTNSIDPLENIGILLVEFFELFGKHFGYDDVVISPVCELNNGMPGLLNKSHYPSLQARTPFHISIQDPSDPNNNISRGSFNTRAIKRAFSGAFDLLVNKCYDLEAMTAEERSNQSILGNIIRYNGETRDFVDERGLEKNIAAIENQVLHYELDGKPPLVSDFVEDESYIVEDEEDEETYIAPQAEDYEDCDDDDEDDDDDDEDDDSDDSDDENDNYDPKNAIDLDKLMGLDKDNASEPLAAPENVLNPEEVQKLAEKKALKRDYWISKGVIDIQGVPDIEGES